MTAFDIFINIWEALTTACIAVNYARLKKKWNKYAAILFMTILCFSSVTILNVIVGYEGFFILITTSIQFLCLMFISDNSFIENLIETLLLTIIVSFAITSFYVLIFIITGQPTNEILANNIISLCIFTRIFHCLWGYALIRFHNHIGSMITNYNGFFLILLFIIYIGTVCVENIMRTTSGINYLYSLLGEICFLSAIIILLYFMYRTRKNYLLDLEKEKIYHIQSSTDDQIAQFKLDTERMSALRHDMINQMMVLEALIDKNDLEQAKEQIHKNYDYIHSLKSPIFTGNSSIDAIINAKVLKAGKNGIRLNTQIDKSAIAEINDISYGILLGNALDNAIEHNSKTNPYIEMSITAIKDQVIICITNPTDHKNNSSLETTKANKEIHGFGTKSMRTIAQKNGGNVLFQQIDNEFVCTIRLPLKIIIDEELIA